MTSLRNLAIGALRIAGHTNIATGLHWAARDFTRPPQLLGLTHKSHPNFAKVLGPLERHGGHTPAGVIVRVLQRILALTAAIWHNDKIGAPVRRSLTAYDH